jgi:amino acid transporter
MESVISGMLGAVALVGPFLIGWKRARPEWGHALTATLLWLVLMVSLHVSVSDVLPWNQIATAAERPIWQSALFAVVSLVAGFVFVESSWWLWLGIRKVSRLT